MKVPPINSIGKNEFIRLTQKEQVKLLNKERIRQHFNEVNKGFLEIKEPETNMGQYVKQLIDNEKAGNNHLPKVKSYMSINRDSING